MDKYLNKIGFLTMIKSARNRGVKYIWHGTEAEWLALSSTERDKYDEAHLLDKEVFSASKLPYTRRGLRFDPSNRKGLIFKKGAVISFKDNDDTWQTIWFDDDFKVDLSDAGLVNGASYALTASMGSDGTLSFTAEPSNAADHEKTVGWFHTLCVNVPTSQKSIYKSQQATACVVPYYTTAHSEQEFAAFYTKAGTLTAKNNYSILECPHPLAGFTAGDILPESVFCQTFRPKCDPSGMVYEAQSGRAVDIYVMSGTSTNTISAYNKAPTRSRTYELMIRDLAAVGKECLNDAEFSFAAMGSPVNCSIIDGATIHANSGAGLPNTGGNVSDNLSPYTSQRGARMVSSIGCEDMCGYLWQVLRDVGPNGSRYYSFEQNDNHKTFPWGTNFIGTPDPDMVFGDWYGTPYQMLAGAAYHIVSFLGASSCGPFSRDVSHLRSHANVYYSSRGSSQVCQ